MPQVGVLEIMVVLIIALLVLGPQRLPEAARALGKGIRELKDSLQHDSYDEIEDSPPTARDDEE
jgi:sec-independent protein translocase protein TatA